MRHLLILFILTLSFSLKAQESECEQLFDEAKEKLSNISEQVKKKQDIDVQFDELETMIKKNPECLSFQKLKISESQIAGFRKYIYAPDRSFNLSENECSEYKVDTKDMPLNTNQGKLGWCFAFTATDLISFHEKTRLSAYDVALQYHHDNQYESVKNYSEAGGFPSMATYFALHSNKGICLEEQLRYSGAEWEKLSTMMKNMASPGKSLQQIFCENQFSELEVFGDLPSSVLSIIGKLSADKRALALLDMQCKQRYKPSQNYNVYEMTTYDKKYKKEDLINELDNVLSKGEPASVGYASSLLSSGVNFEGNPDHASTIIGRKFNKASGQCEYLIKNSWGDQADCQMTNSIRCEKGNYWVPRTALKNNIDYLGFIHKKD